MIVSSIQQDLQWEDSVSNLKKFEVQLAQLHPSVDLVLLPEMFTTGFTMHPEGVAEPMEGPSHQWMKRQAKAYGAVFCGSLVIEEAGKYFNRLLWVDPGGQTSYYDKRHLFSLVGEEKIYRPSTSRAPIFEWKGWKICPLICYDLRFPVYSRNSEGYDLLIYVANWPSRRAFAWQTLLRARAIENQAYCIGVNRIGTDANGIAYQGDTMVLDFKGETIAHIAHKPQVVQVELDLQELSEFREKYAFLKDQDEFDIRF